MTRTEKQLDARLNEIMDEIEDANPFDTFEPHPHEEGHYSIDELYRSRLHKLFIVEVMHGGDRELARYLIAAISKELKRSHN